MTLPELKSWFANFDHYKAYRDIKSVKAGIKSGFLDIQDEHGYTALKRASFVDWIEGIETLLAAKANTEMRDYRTGCTVLDDVVQKRNDEIKREIIALLIDGGADPDTPNYWGVTPRKWEPKWFKHLPVHKRPLPEPRIQNAEHLADHYHRTFKIPSRHERESLVAGQAVDIYVYGPKKPGKQDAVKVKITGRDEMPGGKFYYSGKVETPLKQTHLSPGTTTLDFGPENVAMVWIPKAKVKAKKS
jgi:hypothetical protein